MKSRILFCGLVGALLAGGWYYRAHSSRGGLENGTPAGTTLAQTQAGSASQPAGMPAQVSAQLEADSQTEHRPSASDTIVDEQAGYESRLAAIQAIHDQLTEADREALYHFLRQTSAADDGQRGQVLKNRLLDVLCALNPRPPGLLDVLAGMYQDGSQNIVLRDYAVQHVVAYCQQLGGGAGSGSPVNRQEQVQAQNLLWQAASETGSSIAGTALLGLDHLLPSGWPGIDPAKVGDLALKLAGDGSASELARITAFQVCGNLGVTDALPVVWQAAQQAETVPVQISAIGVLGALGGADQVAFLNDLIQGNDRRLRLPAQHALGQIMLRLKP